MREIETEEGKVTVVTRYVGDRSIHEVDQEGYAIKFARSLKKKVAPAVRTAGQAWDPYLEYLVEEGSGEKDLQHKQDSFALFFDREMYLADLGDTDRCEAIYISLRRRAKPKTLVRCNQAAHKRAEKAWPKHEVGALEGCLCKKYAADTHRNALGEMKSFLRFCVRRRWLKASGLELVKGIGKKKKGAESKEQLTVTEAKQFILVCLRAADLGDQGGVAGLMTLVMGMRRKEINVRVVRNVDMEFEGGPVLWIVGSKSEAGSRYVKIPPILRPYFAQLVAGKAAFDSLWDYSRNGTGSGRSRGKIINALRAAAPEPLTPAQLAKCTDVPLDSIYVIASKLARNGMIGRGGPGQYRHLPSTATALCIRRPGRRKDGVLPSAGWVLKAVKRLCTEARVPVVTAHSMRGLQATLKTIGGLGELLKRVAAEHGHANEQVTKDHYIDGQALADAGQNAALAALGLKPSGDPNFGLPTGNDSPGIIPGGVPGGQRWS